MAEKSAIDLLMSVTDKLNKSFEKQSVRMSFHKASEYKPMQYSSFGSYIIDNCVNIPGGVPIHELTEIYGPEHSGKTTIALSAISKWQKRPKHVVVYFNTEGAVDWKMASKYYGVNLDEVVVLETNFVEKVNDMMKSISHSMFEKDPEVQLLYVIDSIGAMTTQVEYDKTTEENVMGIRAKKIKEGLMKVLSTNSMNKNITLIAINQIYSNINDQYDPIATPGGIYVKFMANLRIQLIKFKYIIKGQEKVGVTIRGKIIKNKSAPPGKSFEVSLMHGQGFNPYDEVFQQASQKFMKILYKEKDSSPVWFYRTEGEEGHKKFRSKDAAIAGLEEDPVFFNNVFNDIEKWNAEHQNHDVKYEDTVIGGTEGLTVSKSSSDEVGLDKFHDENDTGNERFDPVDDGTEVSIDQLGLPDDVIAALGTIGISSLEQLKVHDVEDLAEVLSASQISLVEQYIS